MDGKKFLIFRCEGDLIRMHAKDIALIAILLVAGTVLQYLLAMPGLPLIPDIITAFYCLTIIRFGLKVHEAAVLGIAGGILSMLIPGSIFSAGNLVSGPAGAVACYYFYELLRNREAVSPLVATFLATLISGFTFVAIATFFVSGAILVQFGTFREFVMAYLPVIIGTAVLNAGIVEVLVVLFPTGAAARSPA